jgi:membrane protein
MRADSGVEVNERRVSASDLAAAAPPEPVRAAWRMARRSRRAVGLAWRAAGRGVVEFYNSANLTYASSIAYYTLLSLFPFMLLLLSILSRLALGASSPNDQTLLHMVATALPSRFEFLATQLGELARTPLQLSVAGTLITLWASMGVFGAITSAVNHAWGVEKSYGFFKHKLIAFLMMLAAGGLAITALVLVSAVQVMEAHWFSGVIARFPALLTFTGFAYRNAPTPLFILVVGLLYYFVPNAQVRLRDVWFGAILAGVLWRLAFAGFAWYVRDLSRFNVNGSISAVVVFLVWVYLQAVILLYGVEVTAAYARLRKHLPQQVPAAPARTE